LQFFRFSDKFDKSKKMEAFTCVFCVQTFPADLFHTFCPRCREPLLCASSNKKKKFDFTKDHPLEIYKDFLPFPELDLDLSLGEGNTPLLRLKNTERTFRLPPLYAKNESLNPTHSFKDRGTVIAVQKAASSGINTIGTVSTGNMAASTAAYGARAGLKTVILVKEDTPVEKLTPSLIHHSVLIKVKGDYGDLFRNSFTLGEQMGIYFMNSMDPFRMEGYKVTAFEGSRQLEQTVPAYLIVPVSSGGHLIGIIKAFQELRQSGIIRNTPRFIGVQAEGCSPIASAFRSGAEKVLRIKKSSTIAHAISNPDPPGGNLLLRMIKQEKGTIISVSDEEILKAQTILAENEGIFVQPASATTLAGLLRVIRTEKLEADSRIVFLLTGSGKKITRLTDNKIQTRIFPSDLFRLDETIKAALAEESDN
jgi:threonine synthase